MVGKIIIVGIVVLVIAVAVTYVVWSMRGSALTGSGNSITIKAGGSTWINPQMQVWISDFSVLHPGISVTYDSVGSGTGVARFLQGIYDIAASDIPMPTQLYQNATNKYGGIITIPDSVGAVAFIYNIPNFRGTLNLTADVIAGIYLGRIRYWDDPSIMNINPSYEFPHEPIVAVHRSDGSGTTFTLTLWFQKSSQAWRSGGVGYGYTVNWPVDSAGNGLGGKGNEGVAAYVKQYPWSIGYVELSYAVVNNLEVAAVQNPSTGEFVAPTNNSISVALSSVDLTSLPSIMSDWYPHSDIFMNAAAHGAYPIVGASYLHVAANYNDCGKATAVYLFLKYILTRGQDNLVKGYLPLPRALAQRLLSELSSKLTCGGKPIQAQ